MIAFSLVHHRSKRVVGGRFEFSVKDMEQLLEFLRTEDRIRKRMDLSIPCLVRDQLEAILETRKNILLEEQQCAEEQEEPAD